MPAPPQRPHRRDRRPQGAPVRPRRAPAARRRWTPERWRALTAIARCDLSVARLAEGHTDAAGHPGEAGSFPTSSATTKPWGCGPPTPLVSAPTRWREAGASTATSRGAPGRRGARCGAGDRHGQRWPAALRRAHGRSGAHRRVVAAPGHAGLPQRHDRAPGRLRRRRPSGLGARCLRRPTRVRPRWLRLSPRAGGVAPSACSTSCADGRPRRRRSHSDDQMPRSGHRGCRSATPRRPSTGSPRDRPLAVRLAGQVRLAVGRGLSHHPGRRRRGAGVRRAVPAARAQPPAWRTCSCTSANTGSEPPPQRTGGCSPATSRPPRGDEDGRRLDLGRRGAAAAEARS